MDGKTVLVTGGTSGIGLEAAKALCAKQAACTVLGSSREKGERWAWREPRVCGGWPWRWGGLLRLAEAPCRAGTRRNSKRLASVRPPAAPTQRGARDQGGGAWRPGGVCTVRPDLPAVSCPPLEAVLCCSMLPACQSAPRVQGTVVCHRLPAHPLLPASHYLCGRVQGGAGVCKTVAGPAPSARRAGHDSWNFHHRVQEVRERGSECVCV